MPTLDEVYVGTSVEALQQSFLDNLFYSQGKFQKIATKNDLYQAVAYAIRDRVLERWIETTQQYMETDGRVACYFSAEFLMGPQLESNLLNLGLMEQARQAANNLGWDLDEIIAQEPEPGLGNGGLGRLAACFMDSLATLQLPAIGFGIRYEYGIFDQAIRNGWQVEMTDKWLQLGNPWELKKGESAVNVGFGGRTESFTDEEGNYRVRWLPARMVKAIPHDMPIAGYQTRTTNTLRLWSSEAVESFDFEAFNVGDYTGAVREKMQSETISKVLYPNDETMRGKELRLEQQYFFVSASLQNMIQIHVFLGRKIEEFDRKWAIQMNDTHPSIAVAELMRLLIDEHHLPWETAWKTTQATLGYTNHTLLPEALEKWPISIFSSLLPRHLEIIYEINRRFLEEVAAKYPGDQDRLRRMSLIDEGGERYVRMAHLATVGSHAINGVAALHSELLKTDLLHDFYEMYPARFSNKTNGVTPRRWIALSNPPLAKLVTEAIGDGWLTDLAKLKDLAPLADDRTFRDRWGEVKLTSKRGLAQYLQKSAGLLFDPSSLVDVMVKRIHEYKRQHLKVLHIITLYKRLKKDRGLRIYPRTFVFGGKSAPGYRAAKLIIKLINSVGDVINNDPDVKDHLRVVFVPDYNVSVGEHVYPAADLSEQISLAGKEASGTGNMKFAMNGATTVGTLDGANVEIREEVGEKNFFLFGLTAAEVYQLKAAGYNPRHYYESDSELKEVIDSLTSGEFSAGDQQLFGPLVDSLLRDDPYLLMADYRSYIKVQDEVEQAVNDRERWVRMSILNTAHSGKFSSDRTIREYASEIWNLTPVLVKPGRSMAASLP
jgi:glycogen phosphorylase